MEQKKAFLSGKLSGMKTLKRELSEIKNPDDYEKFLIEYTDLKFDVKTDNEVIYINDDQEFYKKCALIEDSEYISLWINESFTRIYMTTDKRKTFGVRINKINPILIANLISKEKPTKILLNSFRFVKWCNERKIDIRNIYDIPTYIKILTNEVDLDKNLNDYIKQYTNKELLEDDNELNNIIIGNFIYDFGRYLEKYINEFELLNMCKLINENAYYESLNTKNDGECEIIFSYYELSDYMEDFMKSSLEKFKDNAYVLSPLGRIATKFGKNEKEMIKEIYLEDLETLILNELYNNNIYAKLLGDNLYKVSCKFKNFNNVISLITAILTDVFYNMFGEKVKIKLECVLKE